MRGGIRLVQRLLRVRVDGGEPRLHGGQPAIEAHLEVEEAGLDRGGLVIGHVVADEDVGHRDFRNCLARLTALSACFPSWGRGIWTGLFAPYFMTASLFQTALRIAHMRRDPTERP